MLAWLEPGAKGIRSTIQPPIWGSLISGPTGSVQRSLVPVATVHLRCIGRLGRKCHCDPAEKRGKQSPNGARIDCFVSRIESGVLTMTYLNERFPFWPDSYFQFAPSNAWRDAFIARSRAQFSIFSMRSRIVWERGMMLRRAFARVCSERSAFEDMLS